MEGTGGRVRRKRSVRYVQQQSLSDCGIACLAMMLDYYHHHIPLSELREKMDVGRDGTSLLLLREVAKSFGLDAKGLKLPWEELPALPLPAIIHWEENHYVVLERVTATEAVIVDPAKGRRTVTLPQLAKSYSGFALTGAPGAAFETRKPRSLFKTFLQMMFLEWKIWIPILLLSALLMVFVLTIPIVIGRTITTLILNGETEEFELIASGFGIFLALYMLFSWLRARLLVLLQVAIDKRLMRGFVRKMLALPYVFFQKRSVGDLLMRANMNTLIREFVSARGVNVVLDGVLVLLFLGVMFYATPGLAWAVVALVSIQGIALAVTWRSLFRLSQEEVVTQAAAQSRLAETLQGIASVKAAGAEKSFYGQWEEAFEAQLAVVRKRGNLNAYIDGALGALERTSPLIIILIGVWQIMNAGLDVAGMMNILMLVQFMLGPIKSLFSSLQGILLLSVHLERLQDVTDSLKEDPELDTRPAQTLTGEIRVENVSFRFGDFQPQVLHDLSLTIRPGQKVAIVGPSGAGKTTFAKLLVGLYEPSGGRILFDGRDLREIHPASLKRQVGIVLQDAFVFGRTIRENIALHDPHLSNEEICRAAIKASIHDEIMQMPMGYATVLSEGGDNLSGGQRQRLALARSVAHEPAILLLDEATSDLDTINEGIIEQNLAQINCTRLVIAHRLSTVINSDLIVVLHHGHIIGVGTHDELMRTSPLYHQLVTTQLQQGNSHPHDIREGHTG